MCLIGQNIVVGELFGLHGASIISCVFCIVLINRHCNGCQDAYHRDDNHQFDHGKTIVLGRHGTEGLGKVVR